MPQKERKGYNMKLDRYTWEDSLIEAESIGFLSHGAVNTGLRLARVVHWAPKDKPSGLYWKNELAAEVVSVSRASFFRNIKELKAKGFLEEREDNLIPLVPDNAEATNVLYNTRVETLKVKYTKSQNETDTQKQSQNETTTLEKSQNETNQSQNETSQSQNDNPYSVDTYNEDTYSDIAAAGAAVDQEEDANAIELRSDPAPIATKEVRASSSSEEDTRQSQNETEDYEQQAAEAGNDYLLTYQKHIRQGYAPEKAYRLARWTWDDPW